MTSFNELSDQMKHQDREMVPRFLVIAMFALMFGALALVAFARITDRPLVAVPAHSAVAEEISVTLQGSRSDGVHVVAADGSVLARSYDDKKGFIDVIWVSVMRERTVQDVQSNDPVRVARLENGHIAIFDDSTGWKIELIGYGQDNVAAFAKLLD